MSEIGYSLALGPGDRDPEAVIADLREELPAVFPEAYEEREPTIRRTDEAIVWSTGYPTLLEFGLLDRLPELETRGEWAVGVRKQEGGSTGEGRLYVWIDGRWALAEQRFGTRGYWANDVTTYLRREWDVHCESPGDRR